MSCKTTSAYIALWTFTFLIPFYVVVYKDQRIRLGKSHTRLSKHAYIDRENMETSGPGHHVSGIKVNGKDSSCNVLKSDVNDAETGFPSPNLFEAVSVDTLSRFIKLRLSNDGRECRNRFLIYTCTGNDVCGGWGDRLRGITSGFVLALLTNRNFLIDMSKPCDLKKILRPNLYDWETCLTYARTLQSTKRITRLDKGNMNELLSEILYRGETNVIRLVTNMLWIPEFRNHTATQENMLWLRTLSEAEIVGSIIGVLFKYSTILLEKISHFNTHKIKNRRLVCSHIRIGKNPSMPTDADLNMPNVTRIFDFLMKCGYHKESAIFVATDSMEIRNKARKSFSNFISTESKILHIDRFLAKNADELCDGFTAVLLDQHILSRCDILVLTWSGFGRMAAYMRGESHGLFMNNKVDNEIEKVNLSDDRSPLKSW